MAVALLVGAVVAWSFFGDLQTKVAGRCMMMSSEGLVDVKAAASGRLAEVLVRSGDMVRAGDVVASIAQPDQDERIKRMEARLVEIDRRAASVGSLSSQGLALNREAFSRRQDFLQRQIDVTRSRVEVERNQIETLDQLAAQKLATRRSVEEAKRTLAATAMSVEVLRRQLADLERERADVVKREADETAQIELERAEARRELAFSRGERNRATVVRSAFAGRVVEVKAGRGSLVSADMPVVLLERVGEDAAGLDVVMYIAGHDGKKINPGAMAEILPSTAREHETGFLAGKVTFVSDYPATPQALLSTLGSEELVKELIATAAPFEVRIHLDRKNGQPIWTGSKGDTPAVRPGTLCSGKVSVRTERPIGFVIPALRKQTS